MKFFTATVLSLVGSAAAFAPSPLSRATSNLHLNPDFETEVKQPDEMGSVERGLESLSQTMIDTADITQEPNGQEKVTQMSDAIPFVERPAILDGTLAGDVGFDPLGFAKTENDLWNYREAEIKHARLAMLAAAGWPVSEVLDRTIANSLGLTPVLDAHDRVPSLLNGGLGKVSPVYWVACIGAAAAIDIIQINKANSARSSSYPFPGALGFDPLGLYPSDEDGQRRMQTAEIKNGRLAMIAITAFAAQEAVTNMGVVNETPMFFQPLGGL